MKHLNMLQLKMQLDDAIIRIHEHDQDPKDIVVTLQIDRDQGESVCAHAELQVHWDNNHCASGCVITAFTDEYNTPEVTPPPSTAPLADKPIKLADLVPTKQPKGEGGSGVSGKHHYYYSELFDVGLMRWSKSGLITSIACRHSAGGFGDIVCDFKGDVTAFFTSDSKCIEALARYSPASLLKFLSAKYECGKQAGRNSMRTELKNILKLEY